MLKIVFCPQRLYTIGKLGGKFTRFFSNLVTSGDMSSLFAYHRKHIGEVWIIVIYPRDSTCQQIQHITYVN